MQAITLCAYIIILISFLIIFKLERRNEDNIVHLSLELSKVKKEVEEQKNKMDSIATKEEERKEEEKKFYSGVSNILAYDIGVARKAVSDEE